MALALGTRLGRYRSVGLPGADASGEVYRVCVTRGSTVPSRSKSSRLSSQSIRDFANASSPRQGQKFPLSGSDPPKAVVAPVGQNELAASGPEPHPGFIDFFC
jgi:hypothetical protein